MAPLLFFIASIPLAFAAYRLATYFAALYADEDYDESARILPWQRDPWARYIRVACLASLPALMALTASRFELLPALALSAFLTGLLLCTVIDLLHFRVPNLITYPGVALALLAAALLPDGNLTEAVLTAAVAGLMFLVMAVVTRGGIGLGDVKLAVMIGAGLGFPAGYQAMMTGIIAGGVIILAMWLAGIVSRKQSVPYAPFLAVAAMAFALAEGAAFAPL